MKRLLVLFLLTLPALAWAQKGIQFEHALSWEQVKAKAKKENKYIFVDCFTTWCGPCKYMSNTIFTLEAVGNYFNDKFINVKVQFDKTDKDDEYVKSWYATAEQLDKDYSVTAYPTFLFFNPDGEAVHRIIGGAENGEAWLKRASAALDPDKQYYAQMKQFDAGNRDSAFLKKAALTALGAYDAKRSQELSEAYIATQKDIYTKDNVAFLSRFVQNSASTGFKLMLKDPAKVDAAIGKQGAAAMYVKSVILREEVMRKTRKTDKQPTPDWADIESNLKSKYPAYAEEILAQGKVIYFQSTKDWENFATHVTAYMKKYGGDASPAELNQYAWMVFENCKDMTCVTEALEWSKRSFKDKEDPMFMDTYANLLHKMGRTKEAIEWQEKAIALVSNEKEKAQYQQTLDKMKKGEKTWQN